MPRNGSGTYSLPQAAFVPGTTISSAAVNSDFSDIAAALTASIAANGETPITGALKITNGTAANPAFTFITDPDTGFYLAGTNQLGFAAGGQQTITLDGGAVGTTGNVLAYSNGAIPCPVGSMMDWPGAAAPTGWILCFGQAISRTTYAGLFAVCGTTYGVGDGSTTFNLPDYRGRLGVGKDNMGGSAANRITTGGCGIDGTTLGAAGGEQTHVLTKTEAPTGLLTLNDTTHTHQLHNLNVVTLNGTSPNTVAPTANTIAGGNPVLLGTTDPSTTGVTLTDHGGDAAHNNVQPTIVVSKIIFSGVV